MKCGGVPREPLPLHSALCTATIWVCPRPGRRCFPGVSAATGAVPISELTPPHGPRVWGTVAERSAYSSSTQRKSLASHGGTSGPSPPSTQPADMSSAPPQATATVRVTEGLGGRPAEPRWPEWTLGI